MSLILMGKKFVVGASRSLVGARRSLVVTSDQDGRTTLTLQNLCGGLLVVCPISSEGFVVRDLSLKSRAKALTTNYQN